ncbi:hypothetical protein F5X99DRAFT_424911 [Biscogniauxia marginata]|nr:hypothetical protein F5X99DRAFT_424911 [Biscogniauxia marginata]
MSLVDTQIKEPYEEMKGYLKGTHWSIPYFSPLSFHNSQLPWHLLEHVSCSYMSTPGRPPTLLALKQHAQSLSVLISMLAPSQVGAEIDNENSLTQGDTTFAKHQAFDWLNNLQLHYSNEDPAHKKPLNALVNLIDSQHDDLGTVWQCPLDTCGMRFPDKEDEQQYRPFQTHMTILMHANECLERLDHEYSAMGGILSIIPLDSDNVDEKASLEKAKTTLVGQWILYTQHLASRMHELEIAYANSLDLLANEAIVPLQHISVHGPDGRSGREIIFPQDRWILANAGDDVWNFIHQMLDRREAQQDAEDYVFNKQKVVGDMAKDSDDDLKYRGIVKVDLNTRFYRLRGKDHGPIFVLPAYADRPNTAYTRDLENRPTVLTVPTPSWPNGISRWDKKHQEIEDENFKLTTRAVNLADKANRLESINKALESQMKMLRATVDKYEKDGGKQQQDDLDKCHSKTQQLESQLKALGQGGNQSAKLLADLKDENDMIKAEFVRVEKLNKRLNDDLVLQQNGINQAAKALKDLGLPIGQPQRQADNTTLYWGWTAEWNAFELSVRAARNAQAAAQKAAPKIQALLQAGHLNAADVQWIADLQNAQLMPDEFPYKNKYDLSNLNNLMSMS